MRKQFEMTEDDLKELLEHMQPVPMIAIHLGPTPSVQDNANRAWCRLGEAMGFDGMTVKPTGRGDRVFTAEVMDREGTNVVYCSSCGGEFHRASIKTGYSHCQDHRGMRNYD